MRATGFDQLDVGLEDEGAIEVGFRPSGELHVGNLVSIGAAAVLADRYDRRLQVTCCDTDWGAHTHEHVRDDNKQVMKQFFAREDLDGCHRSLAEHRFDLARPYIEAIVDDAGVEAELSMMSDLQKDSAFRDAARRLLERMDEFDAVWEGGFRRRWVSPFTPVCACGFSPAKGASYAPESDSLVWPCWAQDCDRGFHEMSLSGNGMMGIYYLVDPIRDTSSRETAVHVFGGDYAGARKGQKTSKIHKVEEITRIANGEVPHYFMSPLIVSDNGKPLSKSKGTGIFLSDLPEPETFVDGFLETVADVARESGEVANNAIMESDLL